MIGLAFAAVRACMWCMATMLDLTFLALTLGQWDARMRKWF